MYEDDGSAREITVSTPLRFLVYPLDSEEYKKKMEIVEVIESQGGEYVRDNPNSMVLNTIKNRYPNSWEEYLKVY